MQRTIKVLIQEHLPYVFVGDPHSLLVDVWSDNNYTFLAVQTSSGDIHQFNMSSVITWSREDKKV